ncbi:MAG TPA: hypothetical protein VLD61_07070 [Methylomirabilota bacterium]|nr:hypothetical protein [Methylomirabilota bacterium]
MKTQVTSREGYEHVRPGARPPVRARRGAAMTRGVAVGVLVLVLGPGVAWGQVGVGTRGPLSRGGGTGGSTPDRPPVRVPVHPGHGVGHGRPLVRPGGVGVGVPVVIVPPALVEVHVHVETPAAAPAPSSLPSSTYGTVGGPITDATAASWRTWCLPEAIAAARTDGPWERHPLVGPGYLCRQL